MVQKFVYDFVGTSGCGKTTIMNDIIPIFAKLGRTVNVVESSSRTLLKKFDLKLYDKTSDFVQCFISLINWTAIYESIMKYDVTLCTDLGVRSLVYTSYAKNNSHETVRAHRWMAAWFSSEWFMNMVRPYWIYIPLEIDMDVNEKDEHRGFVNLMEHKKICKLTRYTLESMRIPYHILTGSKVDRYLKMERFIQQNDVMLSSTHISGGIPL